MRDRTLEKRYAMTRDLDAFVFDCDGTLLDTLPDLTAITNETLERLGYPTRTMKEILTYVGNGGRRLVAEALPPDSSDEEIERAFAVWQEVHAERGTYSIREYVGVTGMLEKLKARGKKIAVLSNKFDEGIKMVIPALFPGVFSVYHGECEAIPRKPNPEGLLRTLEELGVDPARAAYVGDSRIDMITAKNAGCFALGASWGYQTREDLVEGGADDVIGHPQDVLMFA